MQVLTRNSSWTNVLPRRTAANRHKQLVCLPGMNMERAGTWRAPPGLLTESHHMALQMRHLVSLGPAQRCGAAEEPGHCAVWEGALAL